MSSSTVAAPRGEARKQDDRDESAKPPDRVVVDDHRIVRWAMALRVELAANLVPGDPRQLDIEDDGFRPIASHAYVTRPERIARRNPRGHGRVSARIHWSRAMKTFLLCLVTALAVATTAGAAGSLPAIGTDPLSVDLRSVPGAIPYGLGHAIPLKAARPPWYTDDLSGRAKKSPDSPVPAPADAPLPGEVGIRPGSWMIEPYGCTMNFVFSRGSRLGIGTAGHCTDFLRQDVVLLTLTPGTNNPVLIDIGKVVAREDNGVGDDFALVEIDPALYSWVSATTAVIGGPCGAYYGSGPETVWHYGQGLVIGTGGTPRAGVGLTWQQDAFGWDSAAIFGDSGSPVRVTDLKAAGDLTHLVVDANWLPSFIAGTRIGKILDIADGWQLVSSPLCQ